MVISQMGLLPARLFRTQSNNVAHECDIGVKFAH